MLRGASEAYRVVKDGQKCRNDCKKSSQWSAVPLPGNNKDTVIFLGGAPCQAEEARWEKTSLRMPSRRTGKCCVISLSSRPSQSTLVLASRMGKTLIPFLDLVNHCPRSMPLSTLCSSENSGVPLKSGRCSPGLVTLDNCLNNRGCPARREPDIQSVHKADGSKPFIEIGPGTALLRQSALLMAFAISTSSHPITGFAQHFNKSAGGSSQLTCPTRSTARRSIEKLTINRKDQNCGRNKTSVSGSKRTLVG